MYSVRETVVAGNLGARETMKLCHAVPMVILASPLAVCGQGGAAAGEGAPMFRIAPRTPEETRLLFSPAVGPLGFVNAHRGGSGPGFPENCVATFEATLRHTYAIMEVDPRYTADGATGLSPGVEAARLATLLATTRLRGKPPWASDSPMTTM